MSVLLASILMFFLFTVLFASLGFKFWAQPKTAMERVAGQVELAQHQGYNPTVGFQDILIKIGKLVPQNPTDVSIQQRRLISAGYRHPHALRALYGIKITLSLCFTLLSAGLLFGFQLQSDMTIFQIGAAFGVGWFGPNVILSRKAVRRQTRIRKALPNALDMLVICVESGLGLDQSLMQVSKELRYAHREISDEFAILNLEMRAGKRRAEALHHLGERTDVDEVKKFVSVLVQVDRFGTSISQTLRNFSDAWYPLDSGDPNIL